MLKLTPEILTLAAKIVMTAAYTKVNFDFDALNWLVSPRKQLDLQAVGLGLIKLPPNEGYTFTHSHKEQEEVYIVVKGSGKMQIDGEAIALIAGDIVRVSPNAKRAIKAEEQGIFVICAGAVPMGYPRDSNARYLIDDGVPDYDDIPEWYKDDESVKERNAALKARMLKSQAKKVNGDR